MLILVPPPRISRRHLLIAAASLQNPSAACRDDWSLQRLDPLCLCLVNETAIRSQARWAETKPTPLQVDLTDARRLLALSQSELKQLKSAARSAAADGAPAETGRADGSGNDGDAVATSPSLIISGDGAEAQSADCPPALEELRAKLASARGSSQDQKPAAALCSLCWGPPSVAVFPCGHVAACAQCWEAAASRGEPSQYRMHSCLSTMLFCRDKTALTFLAGAGFCFHCFAEPQRVERVSFPNPRQLANGRSFLMLANHHRPDQQPQSPPPPPP